MTVFQISDNFTITSDILQEVETQARTILKKELEI